VTCGIGGNHGQRQRREGSHLDQASGDPRPRPDLLEAEQPDPDRQQVGAEGGQRERRARGGGQPAASHQRRYGQHESHDDLQQEQPADGGDLPVPGQVVVQVNTGGHGQQQRPEIRGLSCSPLP
jgi:hypothetical protein